MSIEGPSKVDINCEDVEDGTCRVTYCPTEPGNYIVNIKFAEKHIPGQNPELGNLFVVIFIMTIFVHLIPRRGAFAKGFCTTGENDRDLV